MKTVGLLARCAVAAGVSWVLYPVQVALIYVLLLLVATLSNQSLGGPIAGPFLVILSSIVGLPLVALVVLPAVALSEHVARRGAWQWAVPAGLAAGMVLTGLLAGAWTLATHASGPDGAVLWGVIGGLSVLPMAMAGLVVGSGAMLPSAFGWGWRQLREFRRATYTQSVCRASGSHLRKPGLSSRVIPALHQPIRG